MINRMEDTKKHEKPVVIIGAGPAGLTAAYQLYKSGKRSIIIEQDNTTKKGRVPPISPSKQLILREVV